MPEGPQYIPNELRRPDVTTASHPSGTSSSLMQLPQRAATAASPPRAALLDQQHRHAVSAAIDADADGAVPQHQHHHPWQMSPWPSRGKSEAPPYFVEGPQLSLEAAQTLLRHLEQQQQAPSDHQNRTRNIAAEKHHRTAPAGADQRASQPQPLLQQQQDSRMQLLQQQKLHHLLWETLDSIGGEALCRRLLKSLAVTDETPQQHQGSLETQGINRAAHRRGSDCGILFKSAQSSPHRRAAYPGCPVR